MVCIVHTATQANKHWKCDFTIGHCINDLHLMQMDGVEMIGWVSGGHSTI